MPTFRALLLLACCAVPCVAAEQSTLAAVVRAAPAGAESAARSSLYVALGERAGIDRLLDEFVPRLAADPEIGSFFKDTNPREAKKQLGDQFCMLSGGPCVYEGADMKKAHADMKITPAHFERVVTLLQQSMSARGIAPAEQERLLARLAPMRRDIVTVP